MNYILSPDGSTVYVLTPVQSIAASSLDVFLSPSNFTYDYDDEGTLSLTSYNVGFMSGAGGAQIEALYDINMSLPSNEVLAWIQVLNTNDPLNGATSPYLDNAVDPIYPFYSYTFENRDLLSPQMKLIFTTTPGALQLIFKP